MNFGPGWVLIARDEALDPGAWFIFYRDDAGLAAINLTKSHPRIGPKIFEGTLNFEDLRPEAEKVALLGGPVREDNALLILHETKASGEDSVLINEDFSFMAYTLAVVPGKPPILTTANNEPGKIRLKSRSDFLIAIGHRTWANIALEQEFQAGQWLCLPAPADLLAIPRAERRQKILSQIN